MAAATVSGWTDFEVGTKLMSLLIADCPRCRANSVTFDVSAAVFSHQKYQWQNWYEAFSICRHCHLPTIFLIGEDSPNTTIAGERLTNKTIVEYKAALNDFFRVDRYISLRDHAQHQPPEYLEEGLSNAFKEGAACFSIACYNAAATMFRLCVDLVTRALLPNPTDTGINNQPNEKTRRDLGLRLKWMFNNKMLDPALEDLVKCVREDANDGAHVGNLSKEDAEDLLDFTTALLERLVTEPKRLQQAEARRKERRKRPS